jgi:hypothetical protein
MNIFKSITYSSLLSALLATSTVVFAQDTVNNNGSLTFIYDMDEGECTIPVNDKGQLAIRHGDKPPGDDSICKGNSIRYIQFNNVRSAVSVWLASEVDPYNHEIGCDYLNTEDPNNFLFEFRTLKTVTNNTPIKLDTLQANQVGNPVIPGVRLKSRWVNNPNRVNRYLSCIRINFD